jgi:hypothetical protein
MNTKEEKTTPFGYPLSRVYHTSPFGVPQPEAIVNTDNKKAEDRPIPERDTQVIQDSLPEDISSSN